MINKENLKEEGFDVSVDQAAKIKEHYENPKNNKALETYNARGVGRNPDNWGQVDMTINLDKNKIITDIGYEYKGCPTISFTASVFTEALKGIDFEEGLKTTQKELEDINAQENCDDCIKMILVAYIAAHQNYYERIAGTNEEDYTFRMVNNTMPYVTQACGIPQ